MILVFCGVMLCSRATDCISCWTMVPSSSRLWSPRRRLHNSEMKAPWIFEMFASTDSATQCKIAEDQNPENYSWGNQKSSKNICGGADKSLAQPTSWCHRMELIVSLEREVCSWAELQVFSRYTGWKEAHQAMSDFNNIKTGAVIKFFFSATQGT